MYDPLESNGVRSALWVVKRQHDRFPDSPFVPDVFTGAQSPHVDHDVLTRLDVQRSLELKVTTRRLFNDASIQFY